MKKTRDLSPDAKIGFGEHLAYGIGGGFATNSVNLFVSAFLLVYLTEILRINPLVAANIIAVSKILDGISDLLAGRIIDKTVSKVGKARIWLLRMIPATVISLFLLYLMPSSLTGAAQIVYIFVMYNLASTVCYTLTYVAFMTLNGLMTRNQKSRGTNGGVNMIGNVIASLVGNATIIPLLKVLSSDPSYSAYGDRSGWLKLLGIWMVIGMLGQLWIVLGTRERVKEGQETDINGSEGKKVESVPFFTTMKALFTNKYWVYNIIICIAIYFLMGATGSTTTFYMTYVVGNAEFYGLYSTVNSLCMLAAMLVGFGIMAKIGKRNSVFLGLCIRAVGTILPFFSNAVPVLLAAGIIGGIGYGVAGCAFASVIQDTLTYGEWKNGFSMIGMGNAANSFSGKIGNSLGVAVLGWIMDSSGFVGGAAVQTASALNGLRIAFIWMPAAMIFIAAVAAFLYDLDKIYPQVQKDLEEGRYAPGVVPYHSKKD